MNLVEEFFQPGNRFDGRFLSQLGTFPHRRFMTCYKRYLIFYSSEWNFCQKTKNFSTKLTFHSTYIETGKSSESIKHLPVTTTCFSCDTSSSCLKFKSLSMADTLSPITLHESSLSALLRPLKPIHYSKFRELACRRLTLLLFVIWKN